MKQLGRQIDLSSQYLRHGLYGRLTEQSDNLYVAAKFALGIDEIPIHYPQPVDDDPLLLPFTLKPLLYKISDIMQTLITNPVIVNEMKSIKGMAKTVHHEMTHFTNHIMRGWWQEKEEKYTLSRLKYNVGTVVVVLDHKSKTYPCRKNESMSEFFGKKGMSCLGAMIKWHGQRDGMDGHFVFFMDIVMDNTTSQEARDLMPGIEALLNKL